VTSEGDQAIVTVSDTGIGIPAEMLGRVFDLFTQVPHARDRSRGGLGIGLTLVKRLVEMHGGHVRVSSQGEGQGSVFVLGFPRFVAHPSPEANIPTGKQGPAARRVLIADDNVDADPRLRLRLAPDGA